MAPAQYDLRIDNGSTLRQSIEWKDSDGVPVNLSGYRVTFKIRSFVLSSEEIVSFDSDDLSTGQTLAPLGASGKIEFELSDEITTAELIPPGIHAWDLFVESPAGEKDKLVFGQVYV